ncbi:MAG: T9SS type A sorting domain-containing protein, partial [Paramuribaculum sp.]|nr:T9SS type A sorting domain-containing protein [Paramuribaculum sp.]
KIDATAGLKYILQKYASVGQVWDDDSRRLVISPNGNGYDVTVAGEKEFAVELFDMQGRKVATANGIDGSAGLSTSGLNAGVYVAAVKGASINRSEKIVVR